MPRNLDRRVEAVVPVVDGKLRHRLERIFETLLADDVLAWELGVDGTWRKVPTVSGLSSHKRFQELALESTHGNGVGRLQHA
jgi:polyphosphate kinase